MVAAEQTEQTVLNDPPMFRIRPSVTVLRGASGTFVDDVADGLTTQSVVQRNRHQGVRVTGQFWNSPLRGETSYILMSNVFFLKTGAAV